jgi:septal ring factor EnvC (AmiA/AmiB activator)
MGNLSRTLVVATTVLSVAFLGFAGVTTLGGPNWETMAKSLNPGPDKSGGYVFSRSAGDNPQWTATSADEQQVKTSAVLPDVIVAALDHKFSGLKSELDALTDELPQLETRKANLEAAIEKDTTALQEAVTQHMDYLKDLRAQYVTLSQQVVQKVEEGRQTEYVVEARREDVVRLQHQLAVLNADDARLEQIEQQMLDLIRQIDADLAKARQRQQQLKSRLGSQ